MDRRIIFLTVRGLCLVESEMVREGQREREVKEKEKKGRKVRLLAYRTSICGERFSSAVPFWPSVSHRDGFTGDNGFAVGPKPPESQWEKERRRSLIQSQPSSI